MNKTVLTAAAVIALSVSFASAEKTADKDADERLFGTDLAVCTGIPFYGSESLRTADELSGSENSPGRVIIGTSADMRFMASEQLGFIAGGDLLCDFIWSGDMHANHLDYALFGGVKVYPVLRGFNFSICYALGTRSDFYASDSHDSWAEQAKWGNGFRIALEYDFAYGTSHRFPAVGTYWRFMPRGGNVYDNVLAAYLSIRL
jgi:hypothetical protein